MEDIEMVIDGLVKLKRCIAVANAMGDEFLDVDKSSLFIQEAINAIRELQSKSDEVCEWKYEQVNEYASSECGGFDTHRIYFHTFNYCPYCGRKIKVVE